MKDILYIAALTTYFLQEKKVYSCFTSKWWFGSPGQFMYGTFRIQLLPDIGEFMHSMNIATEKIPIWWIAIIILCCQVVNHEEMPGSSIIWCLLIIDSRLMKFILKYFLCWSDDLSVCILNVEKNLMINAWVQYLQKQCPSHRIFPTQKVIIKKCIRTVWQTKYSNSDDIYSNLCL